jgi:cell division septum initiation protein DivIVA
MDAKSTAKLVPAPGERLTPAAARTALFQSARLGHRGLDPHDVREFCRRVEDELISLFKERLALQDEVGRLRRQVLDTQTDPDGGDLGGAGYGGGDAQARAVRILAQAQRTAEHHIGEAQEYCRQLARDGQRKRDEALAAAHLDAALVREEAHEQASRARRAAIAG